MISKNLRPSIAHECQSQALHVSHHDRLRHLRIPVEGDPRRHRRSRGAAWTGLALRVLDRGDVRSQQAFWWLRLHEGEGDPFFPYRNPSFLSCWVILLKPPNRSYNLPGWQRPGGILFWWTICLCVFHWNCRSWPAFWLSMVTIQHSARISEL